MIEREVVLKLDNGLEERPIALLVQMASKYDSNIYLLADNKKVNAKSIMGMMGMGMKNGKSLTVSAEGSDEEAAVTEIVGYLTDKSA